jgi:hypothetical protein
MPLMDMSVDWSEMVSRTADLLWMAGWAIFALGAAFVVAYLLMLKSGIQPGNPAPAARAGQPHPDFPYSHQPSDSRGKRLLMVWAHGLLQRS